MIRQQEIPTRFMDGFEDYYQQLLRPCLKGLRRREKLSKKLKSLVDGQVEAYPEAQDVIFDEAVRYLNLASAPETSSPKPLELHALTKALPGFDGLLKPDGIFRLVRHRDLHFEAFSCYYGKLQWRAERIYSYLHDPVGWRIRLHMTTGFGFSDTDLDQGGVVLRCLLPENLEGRYLVASSDMRLLNDENFDRTAFAWQGEADMGSLVPNLTVLAADKDESHLFWQAGMQALFRQIANIYGPMTVVFDGRWLEILIWAVDDPYAVFDFPRDFYKTARVSTSRLSLLPELVSRIKEASVLA
ncbi:hypothetical protein [Aestuariispira ectoiniformans]|uniref:hypothetical protein n=1 Tax=Aestuariispira ectoiniformans TaxID=2775080 RepID=UPI00223AB232|nr:hypothetical protein [Aestuariispira ectoiniformans]